MSDKPDRDPLGPLVALGFITLKWSLLDSLLSSAIGWLAKIHPMATLVIMDRMNPSRKLDVLRVLIETSKPDLKTEFQGAANSIADAISARNNLIHGLWIDSPDPQVFYRLYSIRTGGKLSVRAADLNRDALREVSDQLLNATNQLLDFFTTHGLVPPSKL